MTVPCIIFSSLKKKNRALFAGRIVIYLFALFFFSAILTLPCKSLAMSTDQGGMGGTGPETGISYSQLYGGKTKARYFFKFEGLVELTFRDFTTSTSQNGIRQDTGWTSFGQRYIIGGHGFIYHPKLLQYHVKAGLTWDNTKNDNQAGSFTSKQLTYDLALSFFNTRPITLDLYASRTHNDNGGSFGTNNNSVSTSYGIRLVSVKKPLPVIRMEYAHWDYSAERISGSRVFDEWEGKSIIVKEKVKDETISDRFDIYTNGFWNFLKTRYSLSSGFVKFSTLNRNFDTFYIRTSFYTQFQSNHSLWSYFQYRKIDTTKLLDISFNYKPPPIIKIQQSYGFEYLNSESPDTKSNAYIFGGLWRYRFSPKTNAKADFHYRLGSNAGNDQSNIKFDASIIHNRNLKVFDFITQYNFFLGRETNNNSFTFLENKLFLSLATRKYPWGKIYTTYDLTYNIFNFKFNATDTGDSTSKDTDEIQQTLRLGAKVRGPLRASWSIELEARYLNSSESNAGAWKSMWIGENQWAQKLMHYTVKADLRYPIFRKGSLSLTGSYTTGTTNSQPIKKYDYESRLYYNISRNFRFSGWWRVEWRSAGWWSSGSLQNVDRQFYTDTKTTDYQFNLDYAWRRLSFSIEYALTKFQEGITETEGQRIYLRVRRPF